MALLKEIFALGVRYPRVFLENLNKENWYKLRQAVVNEPPSVILKNIKKYFWNAREVSPEKSKSKIQKFLSSFTFKQKDIYLFVGHEASRTGAPLIIKNIAKNIQEDHNAEFVFLLCKGGEMESDFRSLGPVYLLDNWNNIPHFKKELSFLLDNIALQYNIKRAYVNSAESRQVLPIIKRRVPEVISLVHELGTYYPKGSWKIIDDNSDVVVFPSKFVETKANINYPFSKSKVLIHGQGLIKEELLDAEKAPAIKSLREDLKIESNAKIVLGCGTPIPRKGIDIFTFVGINFLQQYKGSDPVYFVWLGDGDLNDYKIWVQRDIDQANLSDKIIFVGNRPNTIPWFLGSDLFLMSSRGDPYPCVVHEAMAAQLPIIGFENTGGYTEIINEKNGVILPFGNIIKVVEFLNNHFLQNENSSFAFDKNEFQNTFSFNQYANEIHNIKIE